MAGTALLRAPGIYAPRGAGARPTRAYAVEGSGNKVNPTRVTVHTVRPQADLWFEGTRDMSPFEICGDRCAAMAVTMVETLAEALDARDPYTAGHSLRVAEYARAIASALGVSDDERHLIR